MGKPALPGVAPSEVDSVHFVSTTELRFGFDYCDFVLAEFNHEVNDSVLAVKDSDVESLELVDIFDEELAIDDNTDCADVSINSPNNTPPTDC
jgi:hypothetical protein